MSRDVSSTRSVAVVGAGIAGATCARWLADAGLAVTVFDKSRGVGGRMATRRSAWRDGAGTEQPARFDHGAPGFTAHAPAFVRWVEQGLRDGLLARWSPHMAPGSRTPLDPAAYWLPTPDMPALCRALLAGVTVHTGCTVQALQAQPGGWRLEFDAPAQDDGARPYAAVVVAIPPAQAASLLAPHDGTWAQRMRSTVLLPDWTLMAVTDDPEGGAGAWDLAWPPAGPLASIVRQDARPGRARASGLAHWVAHATPAWSDTHLEAPADEVRAALQAALAQWLGRTPVWHHAAVHRWRYATVPRGDGIAQPCHWDGAARLGLCGDAFGGGGVEGAWLSGRAMAQALAAALRDGAGR